MLLRRPLARISRTPRHPLLLVLGARSTHRRYVNEQIDVDSLRYYRLPRGHFKILRSLFPTDPCGLWIDFVHIRGQGRGLIQTTGDFKGISILHTFVLQGCIVVS
jgi:hypothetical protein